MYIKGRSSFPSSTSSKPYTIACIRRTHKSLLGGALLVHNHLSHKPPTFCLGISGYAGSPKIPRRYIPYIGAVCGDSPQRDRQWLTKSRKATGSGNAKTDSGGIQNGKPPLHNPNHGNRQSAFDRIGPSGPTPRPFGEIGSDESQIAQELRHCM
ncbi:hypothetical protein PIB30_045736 [Stylosanthes scabra]|uniref:Uncharacterized protein n=1 Tax=Stylosanthes scabra TaxID=79078 RepID=A0ABU6ZEZ6_9FABA|nr:hypothetical protein [Stylosanthes scabra]